MAALFYSVTELKEDVRTPFITHTVAAEGRRTEEESPKVQMHGYLQPG